MEEWTQLIEVLVWPASLLFLIWWKDPFKLLLPLVHKVKYKGLEVEFSKGLDEAKREAAQAAEHPVSAGLMEPEIITLVEASPKAAVLEAWGLLEEAARAKVRDLVPADETFRDPLERPLGYLDHVGALVPSTARLVRDLRDLRNQAAHARGGSITTEDAIEYARLTNTVRTQIDGLAELPKVKLTALTLMLLELTHLVDTGRFDDITIEDVYDWIEKEEVLPRLKERTSGEFHLSTFDAGPYRAFPAFYHEQLGRLSAGYAGDHRRKWGVEKSGLCLLLAWTTELIKRGSGWHPDEM